MANQLPPEQRSHSFTKGLNVHGFGLNYAVIKKILDHAQHFGWQFVGSEIPLTLNGAETHADLVFYRQVGSLYLLGECKRVDPSRGAWCFGRSQHILGSGFATLDELHFPDMSGRLHLRPRTVSHKSDSYQVGVEVKDSQEKGDGCPSDQKPIAQSVTQVFARRQRIHAAVHREHSYRKTSVRRWTIADLVRRLHDSAALQN